jgi:DNA-binding NarL/FixJ family response regulator
VQRARSCARERLSDEFEREGDAAARRSIILGAAQAYEAAYAATADIRVRARLAEKIGSALYRSAKPQPAREWYQRAMAHYQDVHDDIPGLVHTSIRLSRQMWSDGEFVESINLIERSLDAAKRDAHLASYLRIHIYRAYQCIFADDCEQAEERLALIACDLHSADMESLVRVHRIRAFIAARHGDALTCFRECDAGVVLAESLADGNLIASILQEKAHRAMNLGYPEVALRARESGVAVARRFVMGWLLADLMMECAYLHHQLGRSEYAAELMRQVVDSSERSPLLRVFIAAYGIPIAIATNDDDLLKTVLLEDAIEIAFATSEPYNVVRVARSFAEWYYDNGRSADADALLRRALQFVTYPEDAWELIVLTVHRCRDASIRATALQIAFERGRPRRPRVESIEAMRQLCIALTASDGLKAATAASAALPTLRRLGRPSFVRTLEDVICRYAAMESSASAQRPAFLKTDESLTPREHEVMQLAMQGLTNRAIAARLRIRERTVESHMTSILARFGLRSRWQIGTVFAATKAI